MATRGQYAGRESEQPSSVHRPRADSVSSYAAHLPHRGKACAAAAAATALKPAGNMQKAIVHRKPTSGYAARLPEARPTSSLESASDSDDVLMACDSRSRSGNTTTAAAAAIGPASTGSVQQQHLDTFSYADILKASRTLCNPSSLGCGTSGVPATPNHLGPGVPPYLDSLDGEQYVPTPALCSNTARSVDLSHSSGLQPLPISASFQCNATPRCAKDWEEEEVEEEIQADTEDQTAVRKQLHAARSKNQSLAQELAAVKSRQERAEKDMRAAICSERKAQEAHIYLLNAFNRLEEDSAVARRAAQKAQDQLTAVSFVTKQLGAAMEVQAQQVSTSLDAFAAIFDDYLSTVDSIHRQGGGGFEDSRNCTSSPLCSTPPPHTTLRADGIVSSPQLQQSIQCQTPTFLLQQLKLRDHLMDTLSMAAGRLEGVLTKGHSCYMDLARKLLMLSGVAEPLDNSPAGEA